MSIKTTVSCKHCSATADLADSPKAWNGWQVVPDEICPQCIAAGLAVKGVIVKENVHQGKIIRTFHVAGQA